MLLMLLACASRAELHALEARVSALEQPGPTAALAPPGPTAALAPPTPEEEQAARQLYEEAAAALATFDFGTARAKLSEVLYRFPRTHAAASATRVWPEVEIVGMPAPPLSVATWLQGSAEVDPRTGAPAGATLLVFFEAWCPHCNDEAPHIAAIARTWGPKGLQVVALTRITGAATVDSVQSMITTAGWTFPVGREQDGQTTLAYRVTGIPAAAIVRDGVVVWRGHPARLTDDVLTRFLAPAPAEGAR